MIDRLRPGETVSLQRFNQLVDAVNAKSMSSPSIAIQDGAGGTGLVPSRTLQPVWGRLTEEGPESVPDHYYQWEQVFPDNNGEWQSVHDALSGGYRSRLVPREAYPYDNVLLNPAVEVNGNTGKVGDVVRLIPTRVIVDEDQNVHRAWLFVNVESKLRPFVLDEDLIPTGGGELDTTVKAKWLDDLGKEVTLYPAHRSEADPPDSFIALGIGRGPGSYFRGTYGWATYQPRGTFINEEWRGEWQIVTLYATTIAQAVVFFDVIEPGEIGDVKLFWHDKHRDDKRVIDSNYRVKLYNNKAVPLGVTDILEIEFNRGMYVWTPIDGPEPHAMTIYGSSTVSTFETKPNASMDNVLVQVPLDTEYVSIGRDLELDLVNHGLKNIADVPRVGMVEWAVTCERIMTVADTDVNSWCEVVIQVDGEEQIGLTTRMTSSRRNRQVPGVPPPPPSYAVQGAGAVNTCSGHAPIELKPGKLLTLWIRKNLSGTGPNDWQTVFNQCHLTFHTIPNVYVNEEG